MKNSDYFEPADKKFSVKDMPEDERPREKLLKLGTEKMESYELLAILLRTGTKDEPVLELFHALHFLSLLFLFLLQFVDSLH